MSQEVKDGGMYDRSGPYGFSAPPHPDDTPTPTHRSERPSLAEMYRTAKLHDECGTLKNTVREKDAVIAALNDTLADVVAFLGPSQMKKFEAFRVMRSKK
jgi:hypothetical protein